MHIAKMNAQLTATAKGFKETFATAGKDAETFAGKMKGIKSQLGEESAFGNFAKMLKGAGAVAGLTLAGQLLDGMTSKAIEVRNRFNEGKISAGQMAEELAKSIPIFGSIISAGRNIRELFTGEEAAAAAMIKSAEAADRATAAIRKNAEALQQNAAATSEFVTDVERTITRMGLSGNGLKLFDINTELADKFKQITEGQKSAGASASGELQAQIDALIKQKNELSIRPKDGWFWEAKGMDTGVLDAQIRKLRDRLAVSDGEIQKNAEIQKQEAAKLAVYKKLGVAAQEFAGWIQNGAEWLKEAGKDWVPIAAGKALGDMGAFIKKGLNSAQDFLAAGGGKPVTQLTDPGGPQLMQAGSQAAASFVAKIQREQSAKQNDPGVAAQKETAENTKKQVGLLDQISSNISAPVELI